MRIVSWNVNGIRACSKKGFWEFFRKSSSDIFCIQETKAHTEQLEPSHVHPKSYHSFWSLSEVSGYSGTATFSKTKPQSASYEMGIYKFDREGRFVITDHGRFLLLNIYFPNGSKDEIPPPF